MGPRADGQTGRSRKRTIEAYEDDGAVVLFDAQNPLAWVETTRAVSLADHT